MRNATTTGAVIVGNYIGTDPTGTLARPNQNNGVDIAFGAYDNIVGGTTPAARNVISGNTGNGVVLGGSSNKVLGNFIGVDLTGNVALANSGDGVLITTPGNTVGGAVAGAGNVISANAGQGIRFGNSSLGVPSPGASLVAGNTIGLGADGTTALGNQSYGIYLAGDSRNVTIGGSTLAARNVISGNVQFGIITDAASDPEWTASVRWPIP